MAAKFKGIDLEPQLDRIIPHIASAEDYGSVLQHLQSVWDNLSLLGQLAGTGTDMSGTRGAFGELAGSLLNQLGHEALKKCLQETGARAQVAINILVRNLFERTADIGFLSSDEDIRAFLRGDRAERDAALPALRARFREYVRKYSVYSDIILLDPQGHVLARLDDSVPTARSADPLVRTAIDTRAGYVESFRATDLIPDGKRTLIYAFRVTGERGAVLGVLCLCFRFEHEAKLIFSNLVGDSDWTVVTILDEAGIVIASSDPFHIPLGAQLAPVLDAEYRIVKFGASEYIATTRAAQPYQGYAGPGWYGHAMVPIAHAFEQEAAPMQVAPDVLARIIHASTLFSQEIRSIPTKAELIQRELNRSVWNGNVSQGAASTRGTSSTRGTVSEAANATFSKILLKEISATGARTKDVFEGSIADLHETVVASLLHDNEFHAALAIDIMDRNLYERANDCRWWALASVFAELLSRPRLSEEDAQAIGAILRTINGLYTVYTNLIVFDAGGRIVAASDAAHGELAGTVIGDEWVARILALKDAQGYAVSSFVPTPLYQDRPTYIYGAAIRSPQRAQAVGGVAIVFDSEPQFAAMLKDALPRDGKGEIKHGGFGLFVEPNGRVIACSDQHFQPGETLAIDGAFLRLAPGAGHSGVTVLGDALYAVGARASSGYREYKDANDGYRNEVIALVFARLCDVAARALEPPVRSLAIRSDRLQAGAKEDVATFRIGRRWFAARTREIVEAIDAAGIVALPQMPRGMAGCLIHRGAPLPVLDLLRVLAPPGAGTADTTAQRDAAQIVVMTASSGARFGLLVDDLGESAEVLAHRLTALPPMVAGQDMFADCALAAGSAEDGELVVVLQADRLHDNLAAITDRDGQRGDARSAA
jgi:chemotaxis signal transduction protein